MRVHVAVSLCLLAPAFASRANPEDQAAQIFAALRAGPAGDPRPQIGQMLAALDAAGLHNLGTVALAELSQGGTAGLRAAASQELSRRAADGALGLALLLRSPAAKTLPPAMAVSRHHLFRPSPTADHLLRDR